MRALCLVLSLQLLLCVSPQLMAQSAVDALPRDFEGIVVAILKERIGDEGSYCLRVVGDRPADALVALLRSHGHEPLSCGRRSRELDFVEIRASDSGGYSATVDDTCGVLCGWRLLFQVTRDAKGTFSVASKRVELEY
jgi:hypothetical protein